MEYLTYNNLIGAIATRVKELANQSIDLLRRSYPETTETDTELVKLCKDQRLTRGDIIEAIIVEEFCLEFDKNIES